ncbi:MAG: ECA polysaccharide chain length modulation protein [Arsenophonus sp. ER-LPS3-MAG3]
MLLTKTEIQLKHNSYSDHFEYELDIKSLFCTLWSGKIWIISLICIFMIIALIISYFMRQKWSSNAVIDLPTVDNLNAYYSQKQFLQNFDFNINKTDSNQLPIILNQVYQEFIIQLCSYDTRREFWLKTDYYKIRIKGDIKSDYILLDELINNIQFIHKDDDKKLNDSIKLIAETANYANQLLHEYIAFANKRAGFNLNNQIKSMWIARKQFLRSLIKHQEMVAKKNYERILNNLKQSLKVTQKQGFLREKVDLQVNKLSTLEMFLLGTSFLQEKIQILQATGPNYDESYNRNIAMLMMLNLVDPNIENDFQTYRYLKTPQSPIKRDSPRRLLMMLVSGIIGAFSGIGIILLRRQT